MAEAEKAGIEAAGGKVDIYQVAETLSEEILAKMHAPAKPAYSVIKPAQLAEYDALLFGVSSRYGGWPAQFKVRITPSQPEVSHRSFAGTNANHRG